MTKEIKDWEKDFDDKNFRYYDTYNNDFKCINDDPLSDEIKQFIQQTLNQQQEQFDKDLDTIFKMNKETEKANIELALNQRNEEIIKMIEEERKHCLGESAKSMIDVLLIKIKNI